MGSVTKCEVQLSSVWFMRIAYHTANGVRANTVMRVNVLQVAQMVVGGSSSVGRYTSNTGDAPSLLLVDAPVLALCSVGLKAGVVLDMGHRRTTVSIVWEEAMHSHACMAQGGRAYRDEDLPLIPGLVQYIIQYIFHSNMAPFFGTQKP